MGSSANWQELMARAQGGDKEAYARLLEDLYPVIRKFLISKLGALGSEEDLAQECLLALHRARHTYDPKRPFEPWMFTVVRYKAIDLLRKRQKQWEREVLDDDFLATKSAAPSYNESEDTVALVTEALEGLPEEMRRAVQLTKIEGLSTEEAATREGLTPAALRSRVSRAYKILRKKLEGDLVI